MRVAIIQIGIPLQSYTRDLANGLSDCGVDVVLVSSSSDERGFIDLSSLKCGLHLLQLDALRHLVYRRIRPRMARFLGDKVSASPLYIHEKVSEYLSCIEPVDLVIGVEKEGLEIAARYASLAKVPYVYYSLELYLEDHPAYEKFCWQRRSEIVSHQGASATIIQDKYRWSALKTANRIGAQEVFFLPVGISPKLDCSECQALDGQSSADGQEITKVLYLGYLSQHRFCGDLVNCAERLPPSIRIHLHGPAGSQKFEVWAREREQCPSLKITTNLLPERDIPEFVRGFDIGLALYRTTNVNDQMTAFSSQKIALYFSEGKPIITFRSETYEELFSRYQCGVMIDSLDDLQGAIQAIMSDYPLYASEAKRAFTEIYNLNNYWKPLVEFLNALVVKDRAQ